MTNPIRYADVTSLLRKLGFDCDTVRDNVRVCEYPSSDTVILLAERPADQPLHEQTLLGVRLQLDNYGLMARAEFDRCAARRGKANASAGTNGSGPKRQPRKGTSPPR